MAYSQDSLWLTVQQPGTRVAPASSAGSVSGPVTDYPIYSIDCEPYYGKYNRQAQIDIVVNGQSFTIPVVQYGSEEYFDVDTCAKSVSKNGGTVTFSGECNFDSIYFNVHALNQSAPTTVKGRNDGFTDWNDDGWDHPGHFWATPEPTTVVLNARISGYCPKEQSDFSVNVSRSWGTQSPDTSAINPKQELEAEAGDDCEDIVTRLTVTITTGQLETSYDYGGTRFPACVCVTISGLIDLSAKIVSS